MSKIEISKLYNSFDHKNHFLKRTLPPLHFFLHSSILSSHDSTFLRVCLFMNPSPNLSALFFALQLVPSDTSHQTPTLSSFVNRIFPTSNFQFPNPPNLLPGSRIQHIIHKGFSFFFFFFFACLKSICYANISSSIKEKRKVFLSASRSSRDFASDGPLCFVLGNIAEVVKV